MICSLFLLPLLGAYLLIRGVLLCLLSILKWIWNWIRTLAGFEPGVIINAGTSAVNVPVTLFGILLSAGAALIIGQIDSNKPIWQLFALFGLVAFGTMAGMEIIIMAKTDDKRRHAFDWATVRLSQFTMLTSIGIVFVFGYMAWAGRLPFAGFAVPKTVTPGMPQRFIVKVGKEGFEERYRLPIRLSPDMYPKGPPEKMFLELNMSEDFSKYWKISNMNGFVGVASEKEPMKFPPQPYESDEEPEPGKSYWFLDKVEAGKTYTIYVSFSRMDEKASPQLTSDMVEKGLKATFYTREK